MYFSILVQAPASNVAFDSLQSPELDNKVRNLVGSNQLKIMPSSLRLSSTVLRTLFEIGALLERSSAMTIIRQIFFAW